MLPHLPKGYTRFWRGSGPNRLDDGGRDGNPQNGPPKTIESVF